MKGEDFDSTNQDELLRDCFQGARLYLDPQLLTENIISRKEKLEKGALC